MSDIKWEPYEGQVKTLGLLHGDDLDKLESLFKEFKQPDLFCVYTHPDCPGKLLWGLKWQLDQRSTFKICRVPVTFIMDDTGDFFHARVETVDALVTYVINTCLPTLHKRLRQMNEVCDQMEDSSGVTRDGNYLHLNEQCSLAFCNDKILVQHVYSRDPYVRITGLVTLHEAGVIASKIRPSRSSKFKMSAIKIKLIHLKERVEEVKCPAKSSQDQQKEILDKIDKLMQGVDKTSEFKTASAMGELEQALAALQALVQYQSAKEARKELDEAAKIMDQAVKDFANQ